MNLLQVLIELQHDHGYLTEENLIALCSRERIPRAKIEELCSFYPHLRRTPPAKHRVSGCRDLSCHMRDGASALDALKARCDLNADIEFETVSCLGRCDEAPACTIDDLPMSIAAGVEHLDAINSGQVPTMPTGSNAREWTTWQLDPYPSPNERYGELRKRVSEADPSTSLIDTLSGSTLRGMGGAGFPTGRKWSLVAAQGATPRYVICNADESEPGTFKDRVLLEQLPHLVIEGMVLAGLAIGASEGWVYIRHEYVPELGALRRAITHARDLGALGQNVFGSDFSFDIQIFVSPGGYILGEETALLEALEGRRGEPRNKPPYPGVEGLHGKPTLINNVETFAHVPRTLTTGETSLKIFSVSGDVEQPGVFEVPMGTTLRQLVERAGGIKDGGELLAFLPGGASTGFLSAEHVDIPMTFDALKTVGSALGSGAVIVVSKGRNLVELAQNLTTFFRNESCGKCVPCRIGTEQAVKLIDAGDRASLAKLPALHEVLRETSICGLGQAALNPIISVLDNFPSSSRTEANEK